MGEPRVTEGRLIEAAAPGAAGMQRRAFGEFVSARGELASYALGWTTGADPREGLLSVGFGVGNPGGATFHAVIFLHDGDYAFSLVDEPFEAVPEGGPDLTAVEARGHESLPFVWYVADEALARDRRGWWLLHWLFGTRAVTTAEVFERSEPILLVTHDDEDGIWQLIGPTDAHGEPLLLHLSHAVDEDPSLIDVLDLAAGEHAERTRPGGPWKRSGAR